MLCQSVGSIFEQIDIFSQETSRRLFWNDTLGECSYPAFLSAKRKQLKLRLFVLKSNWYCISEAHSDSLTHIYIFIFQQIVTKIYGDDIRIWDGHFTDEQDRLVSALWWTSYLIPSCFWTTSSCFMSVLHCPVTHWSMYVQIRQICGKLISASDNGGPDCELGCNFYSQAYVTYSVLKGFTGPRQQPHEVLMLQY